MLNVEELLDWGPWIPLRTSSANPVIPRSPGLYRVRRTGESAIDYIGQTGMLLRQRLAMLKGIYADEMPYRDPHTAAPALWALRHASGCDFEASVVPVDGSTAWRKGLEALAISLYRQESGMSPTVEFGRVPVGYRASSSNNSRLVRLGRRFRGGEAQGITLQEHTAGIPPIGRLAGHPQGSDWCGHVWSEWTPMNLDEFRRSISGSGLYRIRGDHPHTLLYIGQGKIPDRPMAHLAKTLISDHPQGIVIASQRQLQCSYVVNAEWLSHHRLELENDLIAAHILETGEIPTVQFLG